MMKKFLLVLVITTSLIMCACGTKESKVDLNDNVDGLYRQYLTGEMTDSNGEAFWAIGDDETEYAFVDLNGDGQDELLVRRFGCWIYDVVEVIDNKICFANVYNIGSGGETYINTNKQFVSANIGHGNSEQYWISEIDETGNSNIVMYFGKEWETDENSVNQYYMFVNPTVDFSNDECELIDQKKYDDLCNQYTQEDLNIEWHNLK